MHANVVLLCSDRRSSAGIYLRFLTLSDLAAIYTGVLFFTARALFNNNFRKTDELSCKFHRWMSFTACDLSSWALVLVSTARLLSIAWPMKRLITRRRVYASILVTVVVLLGANLPIFIIYGDVRDPVRNRTSLCVFTQDSYEDFYIYVFSWLVLIKFGFLPGVLLLVLNAALVLTVSRSGRAVGQVASRKSHPSATSDPVAGNLKPRLSLRKRKLEADYSSSDTPEVESSELSTGSEFSDGTVSTGDGSEVNALYKADSHLVSPWTKLLVYLKLKGSHQSTIYRLQETNLCKLFSGIKFLWPGDDRDSHKDLVSLSEDVASWHRADEAIAGEEKQSSVVCTETRLSLFGEAVKSAPENCHDKTSAEIPGTEIPGTEIPSTENLIAQARTNMADVRDVQKTYNTLNTSSDSGVNLFRRTCSATVGNTSVRVPRKRPTDHMRTGCESKDLCQSGNPCSYNSCGHDENMQQEHDVSTTTQPTTDTHTTFFSNNTCTSAENTACFNNISETETGRCVLDNCLGKVTDVGSRLLLKVNIRDDYEREDIDKPDENVDHVTAADDSIDTDPEKRASFADIHVSSETATNQSSKSAASPDPDIRVAVSKEIPDGSTCPSVQTTSAHICVYVNHNCVHVKHNHRHGHPTRHDGLVCGCIMSETRCSPGHVRRHSYSPGQVRSHTSRNPASIDCASCPPCRSIQGAGSTESSGSRANPESTLAPACTGHNHITNTDTTNDTRQINELMEPNAGCGGGQVHELAATSGVCTVNQDNKMVQTPGVSGDSQVTGLTEVPKVCEVTQVTELTEVPKVCEVTQVTEWTKTAKVCDRIACRRRSGSPRKVVSKSRSLTRTLLVLNTVFLVCNTPITVYLTGKAYFWPNSEVYSDSQDITVTVANFSMYTSNSINFILYCVTGSRFRGQLLSMFKEMYHLLRNCTRRLSRVCKKQI
ncbi:hypothetical protein BsWGS_22140 [Bradybaena similaris]